jgi:hypothetical protein
MQRHFDSGSASPTSGHLFGFPQFPLPRRTPLIRLESPSFNSRRRFPIPNQACDPRRWLTISNLGLRSSARSAPIPCHDRNLLPDTVVHVSWAQWDGKKKGSLTFWEVSNSTDRHWRPRLSPTSAVGDRPAVPFTQIFDFYPVYKRRIVAQPKPARASESLLIFALLN